MSNPSEENLTPEVPEVAAVPEGDDFDVAVGEYVDDPMVAEEDK